LPDVFSQLDGKQIQALTAAGAKVVGPLPTRRIYFLAINCRKPALRDSAELRRAIAYAIPRETLLNDHFRAAKGDPSCRALNGPFPAGSWAADPNAGSLDRTDRAKLMIGKEDVQAQLRRLGVLTLKYPNDDRRLVGAMRDLCKAVSDTLGINVQPEPVEPPTLHHQVEETHNYDLAYYYYDYPSESYWLWPLFSNPRGKETGLANYLGYENDGNLERHLRDAMLHRDPAQVRDIQRTIHLYLQERMPFIPLWQLDARLAIRGDVEPVPFDPLRIFSDIDQWRRQRGR
jgi:ABC-type oligopeptide transport system substrate-binding subunit